MLCGFDFLLTAAFVPRIGDECWLAVVKAKGCKIIRLLSLFLIDFGALYWWLREDCRQSPAGGVVSGCMYKASELMMRMELEVGGKV